MIQAERRILSFSYATAVQPLLFLLSPKIIALRRSLSYSPYELGVGDLIVIEGANIGGLGVSVKSLGVRDLDDRTYPHLVAPRGEIEVLFGSLGRRLICFNSLL